MFAAMALAAVIFGSIAPAFAQGNSDAKTHAEVMRALTKFADAYAKRDINALLAMIGSDQNVFMYGTGADEKRLGKAAIRQQAERDWAQSESASMTYDWTSISAQGPVAWVASDLTFHMIAGGHVMDMPARMTAVLTKTGKQWLFEQFHMSFPASEQAQGKSFPETKKE
jgi:ketosteroid isomerase-like protein